MSRIEELKKQNPNFTVDLISIMNEVSVKPKYVEMLINLIKNKFSSGYYLNDLKNEWKQYCTELGLEFKKDFTPFELIGRLYFFQQVLGRSNFSVYQEFSTLNEQKLISNNDLTSYKNFEELELQISLSHMKITDKDLESQVLKLHENDEWLVLKPLSYLASLKYGAGTKWCTASKDSPEYYFRYSKRGILIYSINKITGNKVAGYLNFEENNEISFWNITDQRIDSLQSGLPAEILGIYQKEFLNTKKTNWDLLADEEMKKQILWLENYENSRSKNSLRVDRYEEPIPVQQEMTEQGDGPQIENEYITDMVNVRREIRPLRARLRAVLNNTEIVDGHEPVQEMGYDEPQQAG